MPDDRPRPGATGPYRAVGELAAADAVGGTVVQRAVALVRRHPTAADGVLGLVLFALALPILIDPNPVVFPDVREADALGVVLVAAMTLPLTWRRRQPVVVLAVAIVAIVPFLALNYADSTATLGGLIALYSVGAHCERRRALLAASLAFVPFAGILIAGIAWEGEQLPPAVAISNVLTYVGAFAIGDAFRSRRAYVAELQLRLDTAERLRDEEAAGAVAAERARIARELHDVVAHGMSVMVVQATAARRVLDRRPDQAAEALRAIEQTGRESMAEMRHLLGVLRDEAAGAGGADGDAMRLAPQPGLAVLPDLVASWSDAGLPVHLDLGGCESLPAGPDLAAYRIVQESLTNVAKHAGPVDDVRVSVHCDGEALTVTVTDDGRGAAADPGTGEQGYGLIGMHERAGLYGGDVTAGPRAGGGWVVRARLVVPGPTARPADGTGRREQAAGTAHRTAADAPAAIATDAPDGDLRAGTDETPAADPATTEAPAS